MEKYNSLKVFFGGIEVGTLALYKSSLCAFEYSAEWLETGWSISPYSLPLKRKVFIPNYDPFDGLFGVFEDSLPDGWGRLLVDRLLLSRGEKPETVGPLTRLAIVGSSGMGALSYRPELQLMTEKQTTDYDRFAEECHRLLNTDYSDNLDELFALGGSSGGARPKILTELDGEDWIIKFPASGDRKDIGLMEYEYTRCAEKCGIDVSPCRLFDAKNCEGYFGTKRFDREPDSTGGKQRIHMISASGLLETSHRVPALDYNSLMKLTLQLTKDYSEVEKLYRLMCFNVFAHNRDDHSNNFSFLFKNGKWHLAPAYDLTYSFSLGGEHATCVNGNGKNPGLAELLAVAEKAGLNRTRSMEAAQAIRETVNTDLGKYL